MERRAFRLRSLLHQTVQLRTGSLIKTRLLFQPEDANRFQKTKRADRIDIGGVFRLLERNGNVALRRQIVNLVRLHSLHDVDEAAGVRQVAMMQDELAIRSVRILIKMIDPVGIEERSTPLDAVNGVAFRQ